MKLSHPLFLAIFSGLLLSLSWMPGLTFLAFVGFVPLFWLTEKIIENDQIKRKRTIGSLYYYLTFLIWNLGVTWWVTYASAGGAILAFLANSALMTITYGLFLRCKKIVPSDNVFWLLIPFWLCFEFLHLDWDLTWPWLTLGNVFAFSNSWVQWYEYTGVPGGSAWILIANIFIYYFLKNLNRLHLKKILVRSLALVSVLFAPIIASLLVSEALDEKINKNKLSPLKIVLVQPNVDPYNEKFVVDQSVQLNQLLEQVKAEMDTTINVLVLPETFLTEEIWEENTDQTASILFLQNEFISKNQKLSVITGGTSIRIFKPNEKPTATSRKFSDGGGYYDYYNAAFLLSNHKKTQIYRKSKLVPGVERMPFPAFFKLFESLALEMGGISGSLGTQKERKPMSLNTAISIAPVICYESIYGEFVSEYINNGASIIFIITNDGWWDDTPGHRQHLAYATLRSIETRKPIARCANTGITCIIDEYGKISQETDWWKEAVVKTNLYPNTYQTFYVKYGDILSRLACILVIVSLFAALFIGFVKR